MTCFNMERRGSSAIVLYLILIVATGSLVSGLSDCKWSDVGQNYRGTISSTRSGRICQSWSQQYPHRHKIKTAQMLNVQSLADVANYCRNPDGEPEGPWCYTTDSDKRWEYCDVPLCEQCRWSALGQDFQGTVSVTKSGRQCQYWNSQYPHEHRFKTAWGFPDESMEELANYCRNPSAASSGPWCYTTSSNKRWEDCDVPQCRQCKTSVLGLDYHGPASFTRSGRKCQVWNTQYPHRHKFTSSESFPDESMDEVANFCRNPDSEPEGPWCYTTDPSKRWEYCDIALCTDCKRSNLGKEYQGTRSVTWSGRKCQSWSSQSPHRHGYKTAKKFPDFTMADVANHCRNPDNEPGGPWCYTTDSSVRWEYCDIPECWRQ